MDRSDEEPDSEYNEIIPSTIRVKISDDDYKDIIIDWTENGGMPGLVMSVFEQLSSFTGIPVTDVYHLFILSRRSMGSEDYIFMRNPHYSEGQSAKGNYFGGRNIEFLKNYPNYRLKTYLRIEDTNRIYTYYTLTSTHLVNETECNSFFCHSMATRAYTDRIAKMFNSDIISCLQKRLEKYYDDNNLKRILKPRLVPGYERDHEFSSFDEDNNKLFTKLHILDIGSIVHPYCDDKFSYHFGYYLYMPENDPPRSELHSNREPRLYSPNRG